MFIRTCELTVTPGVQQAKLCPQYPLFNIQYSIHPHSCRYMCVSCHSILDLGQNFDFNLSFSLAILLDLCQCPNYLSTLLNLH